MNQTQRERHLRSLAQSYLGLAAGEMQMLRQHVKDHAYDEALDRIDQCVGQLIQAANSLRPLVTNETPVPQSPEVTTAKPPAAEPAPEQEPEAAPSAFLGEIHPVTPS